MTLRSRDLLRQLSPEDRLWLDELCDAFENARNHEAPSALADYLERAPAALQDIVLQELLILELTHRRQHNLPIDRDDYLRRFPDRHAIVEAVFQSWELSSSPPTAILTSPGAPQSQTHGRFIPGMHFAARYRIITLLGKGAMGEVYRADDLQLGQPVALKLLPAELSRNASLRLSILNEVRLARQVTHPHVCRVHDLAEADGHLFLTMEWIEGENLAALLRRIGRFPYEKGLQIARELCLGLAAAHEQGVIHRDLKPANVMIDLRGRVRVNDFGLACIASDSDHGRQRFAGTPAYAAPEQFLSGQTSVQSDLFSLGLILYEVFFGRVARPATTWEGVRDWHQQGTPIEFPELARELDPGVLSALERCLAHDPQRRPASAVDVAAVFSGADPVHAALAIGKTPSPEDLIEAGLRRPLSRGVIAASSAAIVALLFLVVVLAQRTLAAQLNDSKAPDELRMDARRILSALGHEASHRAQPVATDRRVSVRLDPADTASGFAIHRDVAGPVYFWFRQSLRPLVPRFFVPDLDRPMYLMRGTVSWNDPPLDTSGMTLLWLDGRGNLRGYRGIVSGPEAPFSTNSQHEFPSPVDLDHWEKMLEGLTGMELSRSSSSATDDAATVGDSLTMEWSARDREHPDRSWRATAAFLGNDLVDVRVNPVDDELLTADLKWTGDAPRRDLGRLGVLMSAGFVVLGGFAVWSYFQGGRIDHVTVLRLAALTFLASFAAWILRAKHVAGVAEAAVVQEGLARSFLTTGIVCIWYAAIEHYLRRHAPDLMIGWTKLLRGDARDPHVGKDLLAGVLGGLGIALVSEVTTLAALRFDRFGVERMPAPLDSLLETRSLLAALLEGAERAIIAGLGAMLLFLVMRFVLQKAARREWWASVAFAGVLTVLFALMRGREHPLAWVSAAAIALLATTVAMRSGLLATVVMTFVRAMLLIPVTANPEAWYYECGLLGVCVVGGLAAVGLILAAPRRRTAFRSAAEASGATTGY